MSLFLAPVRRFIFSPGGFRARGPDWRTRLAGQCEEACLVAFSFSDWEAANVIFFFPETEHSQPKE